MRKKLFKLLTLTLSVVTILSCLVFYSAAEEYTFDRWQYTAVTNTIGKSSVVFWETLSSTAPDTESVLFFNSFCRGGTPSKFKTTMEMRLHSGDESSRIFMDSEVTGSNVHEATITKTTAEYLYGSGYAEHQCYSKTNSDDFWQDNFYCRWTGGLNGWTTY